MIEDAGGSSPSSPESDPTDHHTGGSPHGDTVEINLLQALVVDSSPEAEKTAAAVRMRGHDVRSINPNELEELEGNLKLDLLLVQVRQDTHSTAETIAFVRRMRRLYRDRGIVVLGLLNEPENDALIEKWMAAGVDDFVDTSHPGSFGLRMKVAEERVSRNRGGYESARELNASLRRYETAFLNGGDAQLIVDPSDSRILESCVRCKTVLGWRREEMNGKLLSLVFPDLYRRDDLLSAGETAQKNRSITTVSNITYRRPAGARCVLEARIAAVPWGEKTALSMTFIDVTIPRARQERRLRAAKLDTVSSLSGGVADDLSNLFTAVRGNLALIGKQPTLGTHARELLQDAEAACNSADKMVSRLRLLARSNVAAKTEDGNSKLHRQRIDLRSFMERIVSFELLGANIRPTYEFSEDLLPVEVDEAHFEQAIQAIVTNAIDAMPSGGTLRVIANNYESPAAPEAGPRHYVLISIVDDGPGIGAVHLPHVFDPYFSTRSDHAGLGLSTCQALIREHGGIVDLEPAPVRGTVVRVYLPSSGVAKPADSIPGAPEACANDQEESVPGTPRRRVLVMDDDKDIRVITKKILTSHGFDVYCTKDGREAIEVYHKAQSIGSPFDVSLFDLDVRGGMGGKDAVARLRRDFPSIRVILMTGYVDDALLENHEEHGFSGVITKPFQIDQLVATLNQFANAGGK